MHSLVRATVPLLSITMYYISISHVIHHFKSNLADNIALRKQVDTSSNYDPVNWPASAAVDGETNQRGKCGHTSDNSHFTTWWTVNLGQPSTINYITIYYRAGYGSRFAGYQIFVSNTTDLNNGQLCYEDASTTVAEVATVKSHQCQHVAQYVTIYNYRNTPTKRYHWYSTYAILELCEVLVFGE
ncbi:Fucolectin-6 [Mizuhopecten yessoensis]|uniref:Fucolectin-6 n=1 Tax=Mizuhopecten yessoensis TaxID=6573 RepID=A0A210PWE4_MIZYE|nr:Fucolectin-6 [Mizuhopecten yessoensis]